MLGLANFSIYSIRRDAMLERHGRIHTALS